MPSRIRCLVRDSRGYVVEGLPVYLASRNISQSGLTNKEGIIEFITPIYEEVHVYLYNPIIKEFVGEYLTPRDEYIEIEIPYSLTRKAVSDNDFLDRECNICGDPIAFGERVYIFHNHLDHYDCFHRDRKARYISSLEKIYRDIDNLSVEQDIPHEELIYGILEKLGFMLKEDVDVDLDMHPIAAYEAVRGVYQGKDIRLDILAVYPCLYPDMNLILAIALYDTYRSYSLHRIAFTPYKLTVVGWGLNREGVVKPGDFITLLKDIIAAEIKVRGICG
jgi:hypothetical protein